MKITTYTRLGGHLPVLDTQYRLTRMGYEAGPTDGIWGPETHQGLRDCLGDYGSLQLGDGPGWGLGDSVVPTALMTAWGLAPREVREAMERDLIRYASRPYDWPVNWCGLWIAHAITLAGLDGRHMPMTPETARSWAREGTEVDPSAAQRGDVVVFWRGSPDSWMGHVGLWWGVDGRDILVLGGNQGGAVRVSRYPARRLLAVRRLELRGG